MRAAVRRPWQCPCMLHAQPYTIFSPKSLPSMQSETLTPSACKAAHQPVKALAASCPADGSAKAASKWRPSKVVGRRSRSGALPYFCHPWVALRSQYSPFPANPQNSQLYPECQPHAAHFLTSSRCTSPCHHRPQRKLLGRSGPLRGARAQAGLHACALRPFRRENDVLATHPQPSLTPRPKPQQTQALWHICRF